MKGSHCLTLMSYSTIPRALSSLSSKTLPSRSDEKKRSELGEGRRGSGSHVADNGYYMEEEGRILFGSDYRRLRTVYPQFWNILQIDVSLFWSLSSYTGLLKTYCSETYCRKPISSLIISVEILQIFPGVHIYGNFLFKRNPKIC